MEEEYSIDDPTQLMEAASEFALYPGTHSDSSAKDFLHRFPLPIILNALQTKSHVVGLEDALVPCLDRIFRTKYGASLIPHFMSFVVVGLGAASYRVRVLACKTVSCLLENSYDNTTAAQLIVEYNVYPLLLNCLIAGDEQVAAASMDTVKTLSGSLYGMDIVFPADPNDAAHLKNLVARCSSLRYARMVTTGFLYFLYCGCEIVQIVEGRVRVLALIVKLFSISSTVASVVYKSNLLSLLVEEVRNVNDMLIALSVLELLYELAEIPHGTEFLSRTTLLQLLSSIIRNSLAESILRSRSMMISGRILSKENVFTFTDESSVSTVISAIDGRFGLLESQDADEFECALEALGNIGSSVQGATLLLSSSPPAARHVVNAAFNLQGRGKQLAALHALGNISGETRSGNNTILNDDAEESLRRLIYEAASKSPKLTPSGLFLSVLQQESDLRLAGYRLIKGLVVRQWCLMEICSRQELINIVTDTYTEGTKIGMESRYNCCLAIHKAFVSSTLISDPSLAGVTVKLQEAVKNGPYLARKHSQAQPVVMTEDRF